MDTFAAVDANGSRGTLRRFRRGFALTAAVLLAFIGLFGVLNFQQGPKLSNAQVDLTGVVSQSGQQLRLFANQAVATVTTEQLTVTPAAAASVSTSGDVIAVQFDEPLRYATAYTVEIAGVTSQYIEQPATFSYTFTTNAPPLYFLDRGDEIDQVIRTGINTTDRTIIYSAPKIQDYAVFDAAVAVVAENSDGNSTLVLVNELGNVEDIALPGEGTIDLVRSNPATGYLGFSFTSSGPTPEREFASTLFTIDLNSGRLVDPVTGIDGAPVSALEWLFVPLTTQMVVQNTSQSVFAVDTAIDGTTVPVGQFNELNSVSTDGTTLVLTDPFGPIAFSLADRTSVRLDPSPLEGVEPFGGTAEVLPGGDWVQQVALFDETTGRFRNIVVVDDGERSRVLFKTVNDEGSIVSFAISPNNQYVAIEMVPNISGSSPDGYTTNGRATEITTVFVDISSGAVVKSVEGFRVSW